MTKLLKYPVLLRKEAKGYLVTVPDIPGALTEAGNKSNDAIGLMLEDKTNYPKATPLENLNVGTDEFKILVTVDMDEFR